MSKHGQAPGPLGPCERVGNRLSDIVTYHEPVFPMRLEECWLETMLKLC